MFAEGDTRHMEPSRCLIYNGKSTAWVSSPSFPDARATSNAQSLLKLANCLHMPRLVGAQPLPDIARMAGKLELTNMQCIARLRTNKVGHLSTSVGSCGRIRARRAPPFPIRDNVQSRDRASLFLPEFFSSKMHETVLF
jgi:hypothetical protein